MRTTLVALVACLASACASQATLTVDSQPQGALISDTSSGVTYGMAPVTIAYDRAALARTRGPDGCYMGTGLTARWASGVATSIPGVKICGSTSGAYTIGFARDQSQPGFADDMRFALQLQSARAQQDQAAATQASSVASMLGLFQPQRVSCTSVQTGNRVQTDCR